MTADRGDAARPHWRDWTWQLRERIRSAEALARWVLPTADEKDAIALLASRFHFVITPYYAALMDPDDPNCPIR
ncbi:MAG: arginine 2,3-aminomutase, partial [Myxococcota bacterium]|nr:arginine 2,3-aminomutase [Myxococcota bacterium]